MKLFTPKTTQATDNSYSKRECYVMLSRDRLRLSHKLMQMLNVTATDRVAFGEDGGCFYIGKSSEGFRLHCHRRNGYTIHAAGFCKIIRKRLNIDHPRTVRVYVEDTHVGGMYAMIMSAADHKLKLAV